ncbi:MAG: hypothetical protein ACXW3E_13390, partial [Thermoanaerobaculia bacterium]
RGNELLRSASADDRKKTLTRLAREALLSVRGEGPELRIAAADRELVDETWCRQIAPGVTIGANADIGGGCLLHSGAVVFDNSIEQRAKRLEPVWRKALAGMYRV